MKKSVQYNTSYTMRNQYFIYFIVLCASCNPTALKIKIMPENIKVRKIDKHPFLSDHRKRIVVMDNAGTEISSMKMYIDTGEGCDSNLFEIDTAFVLIDCNGQWFYINKKTGRISKETWEWRKPLPGEYVGTFISKPGNDFYEINKRGNISIDSVYKYKDPND
jgi:hypothetical protein